MQLKNVMTFVKAAEFGSFTRAAENIGYSQATVTAQIKALEAELSVPLFDRIGKRVYLTGAGKSFLPYAVNVLKAEEEALQSVRASDKLQGELRICSASSYATSVLPSVLLRFRELHPEVNITVKISDFPEDTKLKLLRDETDLLAEIDDGSDDPQFLTLYRKKEKVIFVTHPDNPLLERDDIGLKDIVEDDFIVADRSIGYCAMLEKELGRRGLKLRPVMEIGSVEAIINVLLGGFGTTLIPEYTVSEHIADGSLAAIKTEDVPVELYAHVICSKNKWLNQIMREFIRVLNEEAES